MIYFFLVITHTALLSVILMVSHSIEEVFAGLYILYTQFQLMVKILNMSIK